MNPQPKQKRVKLSRNKYLKLTIDMLNRDNHSCRYCGSSFQLQPHHRKFRSQGGGDTLDNLVTLCAKCHRAVHDRNISLGRDNGT